MPMNEAPIIVATDFSETSDRAMDQAAALARALGARLELMHVHAVGLASVPPTLDLAPVPPTAEAVARAETALADRIAALKQAGVTAEVYTAFGQADDEIVRRAAEVAPRLLVVGTHGMTGLRHALLGSVAERVLKHAPCPVLVVPAAGRASAVKHR